MKELDTYFENYWDKLDKIKNKYDTLFVKILEELEIVFEKVKLTQKEITPILENIDNKLDKLIEGTKEFNKTFNKTFNNTVEIPVIKNKVNGKKQK